VVEEHERCILLVQAKTGSTRIDIAAPVSGRLTSANVKSTSGE
jgi:hypothetical protein